MIHLFHTSDDADSVRRTAFVNYDWYIVLVVIIILWLL